MSKFGYIRKSIKSLFLLVVIIVSCLLGWQVISFTVTEKGFALHRLTDQRLSMEYPWLSHPGLPRRVSFEEYKEYMQLLQTFLSLIESADATYVMYYGTLLGSYRTHNMLPWDQDIDLIVKYDDMCKIIESVKQLGDEATHTAIAYYLHFQKDKPFHGMEFRDLDCKALTEKNMFYNFKFFPTNASLVIENYKWPMIDVFLFQENTTHVWILYGRYTIYIKRERFYPLSRRPFGHLWLQSPRDVNHSLHALFGNFEDVCLINNPLFKGKRVRRLRVSCQVLFPYYPWVTRQSFPSYTEERLTFQNRTIHSIVLR